MQRRTFLFASASAAALSAFRARLSFAKGDPKVTIDPLLSPWSGKYGGTPPFDHITPASFKPAIAKGMDDFRAELAAIASAKEPATFENTIAAMENSGRGYAQATRMFGVYTSVLSDKTMQALETELAPVMTAFDDEITQNTALFARIKAVYDGRASAKLTTEQLRLVDTVYRQFARRGAALDAKHKLRLGEINKQLASLYTTFSQNQLHDEESQALVLDGDADAAGLPESVKTGFKLAADAKQHPGKLLVANTRSAIEPFLTYSTRRDLREKAWHMFVGRGESAGAHDNRPVIRDILALRYERAKLLGFASHAHWIVDANMAKTPDAAMALMMKVWKAASARAREEVADMQALATADKIKVAAWDYRFYAEKVRKAKYDLDQDEVKQYFQLDKMRDAMFWASGQLYGFVFGKLTGVAVPHPDVTVYQVTRGGTHVGLWYFDPYARDGKRSGAWMSEYRTQEAFKAPLAPIVSNNSNFVKGKPGEPVLISWDDARTLFHEFGHALHGLNSAVHYPTLAGTNTLRDFVEFPSQLNEHWFTTPEILKKFALHYQTGKPIPDALVAKIEKAKHFNSGFGTVEYLSAAIYDMKIHTTPADKPIDATAFEAATMKEIGMPAEIVMRHRPTQFGHIFSGDEYSAGYYAYIWADTLTADAAEAFVEAKSFYDKATAKRLHDDIMSVGNSIPPEEAFHKFRGRDVDTDALMRDRGFPVTT